MSTAAAFDPLRITTTDFWNGYNPIANRKGPGDSSEMYYFYPDNDEDMKTVQEHAPGRRVWTWVTSDDGSEIIMAGFWQVDALMYFVTEEQWEDENMWLYF